MTHTKQLNCEETHEELHSTNASPLIDPDHIPEDAWIRLGSQTDALEASTLELEQYITPNSEDAFPALEPCTGEFLILESENGFEFVKTNTDEDGCRKFFADGPDLAALLTENIVNDFEGELELCSGLGAEAKTESGPILPPPPPPPRFRKSPIAVKKQPWFGVTKKPASSEEDAPVRCDLPRHIRDRNVEQGLNSWKTLARSVDENTVRRLLSIVG